MKGRILGLVILTLCWQISLSANAFALKSSHPLETYDRGIEVLNSYQGDPATLYEAQTIFAGLIKKFPDSPYGYLGLSRVQKIQAYLYGNRYSMIQIRDEVLPFAIKALELGPSIRDVHEHYSSLEKIYEDFYANQKEAQSALMSFPDRAETFLLIGMFFGDQGEEEKALEFYKGALGLKPSTAIRIKILERLGLLYLHDFKDPQNALSYFQEAVEVAPHLPVMKENLGLAYLGLKNYRKAVDQLTKAMNSLANAHTRYYLWQAKAFIAEEEGKTSEAIKFLEAALNQDKHNIALHFKLGNFYYNLANYESAYKHFMEVISLEPQNSGAYYFAGRSASSLGETARALNYYKQYLQLDADSEEAAWIRENVPEFSQN
jgi:tetratricopeptide (TPR) repeat protein